jgi:hypothetical protein
LIEGMLNLTTDGVGRAVGPEVWVGVAAGVLTVDGAGLVVVTAVGGDGVVAIESGVPEQPESAADSTATTLTTAARPSTPER